MSIEEVEGRFGAEGGGAGGGIVARDGGGSAAGDRSAGRSRRMAWEGETMGAGAESEETPESASGTDCPRTAWRSSNVIMR